MEALRSALLTIGLADIQIQDSTRLWRTVSFLATLLRGSPEQFE
jgi:hypothetical protein